MLNCSIGAPFTITQTYKDEGDIKKVSLQLTQSQWFDTKTMPDEEFQIMQMWVETDETSQKRTMMSVILMQPHKGGGTVEINGRINGQQPESLKIAGQRKSTAQLCY